MLTTACVVWEGGVDRYGYGYTSSWHVDGVDGHRTRAAHRVAYVDAHGYIPLGMEIDHLCENRICVNPQHLEAVSLKENQRRRRLRRKHCKNGHAMTADNTYVWTNGQGHVRFGCRECRRAASAKHEQKRVV